MRRARGSGGRFAKKNEDDPSNHVSEDEGNSSGLTRNDVKVWIEDKMLVLEAEKKPKTEVVGEERQWPPEGYGKYNTIALPETVDIEKIRAEFKDGVLYLTIPKAK